MNFFFFFLSALFLSEETVGFLHENVFWAGSASGEILLNVQNVLKFKYERERERE